MGIYQLNLHMRLGNASSGNDIVNVFNYLPQLVNPTPEDTAALLIEAFQGDVIPAMINVMSVSYNLYRVVAFDVYDVTNFAEVALSNSGAVTGEYLSKFVAWTFQTPRLAAGRHKRARKSIGGVSQTSLANDEPTTSAIADLAALGTAMGSVITPASEANVSFQPILVQKERYLIPNSDPAAYGYRYYSNLTIQLDHILEITEYEAAYLSTQNSRKR